MQHGARGEAALLPVEAGGGRRCEPAQQPGRGAERGEAHEGGAGEALQAARGDARVGHEPGVGRGDHGELEEEAVEGAGAEVEVVALVWVLC